nr:MAG TPA: pentapeptide repeat protein [Caudoviricetes sp.]
MIGYKAFDMELKCRGFQFEVGKTYDTGIADEKLELCTKSVFHFCREFSRIECVSDYKLSKSRVCEVVAEGSVVSSDDGKFGTNKIMLLRELTREEIEKYGNRNSGNRNSGNWNSGNWNSGNWNSGDRNSGNCNSGDRNSGNWNSGDWNSGYWNSGDWNSGDRNSGDRNSGNWNSGDWNSGYFNVDSPLIRIFGKETDVKIENIHFPDWLYFPLTQWVSHDTATDEEKKEHEREIELSGGFLKVLDYKEAFRLSWNKAKLSERKQLFALPNWDNEIFLQISGIDAEKEIAEEEK